MRRRKTISEQIWPKDTSFDSLKAWPGDAGCVILRRVWAAYDDLDAVILSRVDWSQAEGEIERSLTAYHSAKIQERQTGDEPFILLPEMPEFETRQPAPARSNEVGHQIIGLPGAFRRNILCRMPEFTPAPTPTPSGLSKLQVIVIKIIALTAISLALIFGQSWASTRYYRPEYSAGFYTGLLEGALMPAALPGLLRGKDVPIYAPNNDGRSYKIGFILGLNGCGTFFFGVAFWQPRRRR